jgi:sulfide dehydrogenase cytochrome subunit
MKSTPQPYGGQAPHSTLKLLLPLLLGSSLAAHGAPPPGQLLSSMCYQCHGTNGQAVSGFESIAGKSATDMYKTLLEMSQRRPENIMDLQARAFTTEQLRKIANYLATLPPTPPTAP